MRTLTSCLAALLFATLSGLPLQAQTFAPDEPRMPAMDGYGSAVAVSEGVVFVGEPNNTYHPGAVYVYRQENGEWARTTKINAQDGTQGDGFGSALATGGGLLMVGSRQENGAAYLFQEAGASYEQVARLVPDGGAPEGEGFGSGGMALGDGWAAIGAPGASADGKEGAGAVYIFRRDGSDWQQAARLTGSTADTASAFGAALDYEEGRLLIGAPGGSLSERSDREPPTGRAYLFTREGDTWTEAGMIENPSESRAAFGAAVSLQQNRAYVGAPRHGGNTGMVALYALSDDGWQPAGELHPFDGGQRTFFGTAIAHTGGETWVSALGAKQLSGRIYAFAGGAEDGEWTSSRQVATGEAAQDLLGRALAATDEIVVAGASGVGSGAGAAMIFAPGPQGNWTAQATVEGDPGGLQAVRGEAVNCENGQAGLFGCQDVQLLSFTPISDLGGERGVNLNDIWGWTDPETGTEYALVGRTNGLAFVDISDPQQPVYVGELPMTEGAQASSWRDVKVYEDHAFVVSDNAGEHGMQVFDLTKLREHEMGEEPITFEPEMVYDQINSAHNIVMNKDTGYAYIVGAGGGGQTCGGGLHMVNVQTPTAPTFAGCFADERTGRKGTGYSHDAQCLLYNGPDTDYQGQEICFGSNETALSIADVTDKENPKALATAAYPNSAYTHQGWISEDHRYFYVNDELDELSGKVDSTRTMIWDITELDNPQLVKQYTYGTISSDHNLYVKGDRMYMSNYASGLRVHDISDPTNPREIAHFDTTPVGDEDPAGFTGTWSNYPYFESGVVAVSSIGEGLFLLKPQPDERESL